MRLLLGIFLGFLLNGSVPISLVAQQFACDGRFFISSYINENDEGEEESYLHRVDVDGNQVLFIEPITYTGVKLNGVGYNQRDNLVYAINQTSVIREDGRRLYQILRLYADGTYERLPLGEGEVNTIRWDYGAGDCSPEGYFVVHDRDSQQLHYLDVSGDQVTLQRSVPLRWAPEVGVAEFYVDLKDIVFETNRDGSIFSHQRGYEKEEEDESAVTRGAFLKINGDLNSPELGLVSVVGRPDPEVLVQAGGMFFDANGKLYTYGLNKWPINATEPRSLVAFDKTTGAATLVGEAFETRTTDGCSCPATLGLAMQIASEADACQSTIDYSVIVRNNSVAPATDVVFTDTLPVGMRVAELVFEGEEDYEPEDETGVGYTVLTIPAIALLPGEELSFTIRADARGQSGTVAHQAYLTNLPAALGSTIASDDTTTAQPYDPSVVTITQEIPNLALVKDTLVCPEQGIVLSAGVDPAWSYYWTGPDAFYSEEANPVITISEGVDSLYYYLHQQRGDCTLLDSVLVRTLPSLRVAIAADTAITAGATVSLAPAPDGTADYTYAWTPSVGLSCTDCANPQAAPTETTEYELIVSNSLGCSRRERVRVEVLAAEPYSPPAPDVQLPNAFTPNNDGLNDVFMPVGSTRVRFQRFEVYNRWGELLFRATDFEPNDISQGWDGTYRGGMAATGTYTYRLVAVIEEKGRREYQGQVQLLR